MSGGNGKAKSIVIGFVGALAVLTVLLSLVGVDRVVSKLALADPLVVGGVVVAAAGWLVSWGLALHTVFEILGVSFSSARSVLLFSGAMFANNITPFGQAGGEPVTAGLISKVMDARYETGLAAIASVDTLNFLPAISLAVVGVSYYTTTLAVGRNLKLAAIAVVALAAVVPTAIYQGWQRRYELEHRAIDNLTPLIRRVGAAIPKVSPPKPDAIEERIEGFFHAIERIATDRRRLAYALGFSTFGWVFHAAALWLSFYSLGYTVSPGIVLFVVPIGAIAGITPLPGGLGGIEAVLVTLLTALTGFGTVAATASVVIYRGVIYWLPTLVGGGTMAVFAVGD